MKWIQEFENGTCIYYESFFFFKLPGPRSEYINVLTSETCFLTWGWIQEFENRTFVMQGIFCNYQVKRLVYLCTNLRDLFLDMGMDIRI